MKIEDLQVGDFVTIGFSPHRVILIDEQFKSISCVNVLTGEEVDSFIEDIDYLPLNQITLLNFRFKKGNGWPEYYTLLYGEFCITICFGKRLSLSIIRDHFSVLSMTLEEDSTMTDIQNILKIYSINLSPLI